MLGLVSKREVLQILPGVYKTTIHFMDFRQPKLSHNKGILHMEVVPQDRARMFS